MPGVTRPGSPATEFLSKAPSGLQAPAPDALVGTITPRSASASASSLNIFAARPLWRRRSPGAAQRPAPTPLPRSLPRSGVCVWSLLDKLNAQRVGGAPPDTAHSRLAVWKPDGN